MNTSGVNADELTDLQLVDVYIEKCQRFVNPYLLRQVCSRGLYNIINYLPGDIAEAKSIARARLVKAGKYFDDPEIDAIFQEVNRLNFLMKQLQGISVTDVSKTLPILEEMTQRSIYVRDYFKEAKIPDQWQSNHQ